MTLAIILTIFAAVVIVAILWQVHVRKQQLSLHPKPAKRIQPIDIEAFRNLVDPAEREYLRLQLRPSEFHTVQRKRLLATLAYVQAVDHNAVLLLTMGESARTSADPSTAEAARQLVDNASMLRTNAFRARCQIYMAWLWPGSRFGAAPILHGYVLLNGSAMLLGRLQNPAAPVRISAT